MAVDGNDKTKYHIMSDLITKPINEILQKLYI